MTAIYEYAIGLTQPPDYLYDLGVVAPKQIYQPYSKILELGNGETKRMGYHTIEWYWEILPDEEVDILDTICPNGSVEVYVRSLDEFLAWHTFRAKMIWPVETPDIESGYRRKVVARFKVLEQID